MPESQPAKEERQQPSQLQDELKTKMSEIRENEIRDLLAKSEISLLLDTYDDIFSDFDPRPYSERALSDDFLLESRKAARDKKHGIELKFLLPADQRKPAVELNVKKRLRDHFKKHLEELERESKGIMKKGVLVAALGFVIMVAAAAFFEIEAGNFLVTFLGVVFEPAGWFMVWFGLDQIFYSKNEKKPELEFYKKMANANIVFISI